MSGNEGVARYHLPVVKSKAGEFEKRCKARGLSQDSMSFTFNDSGTQVHVQYRFGEMQVQIFSPTVTKLPEYYEKTLTIEQVVWFKEFDDAVFGSYNGMFFDLNRLLYPDYETRVLTIASITKVTPDPTAYLAIPYDNFVGSSLSGLYKGVSSSNYLAHCQYPYGVGYRLVDCNTLDANLYGYHASCFYGPDVDTLRWRFGGDVQYPELESETTGEDSYSYSTRNYELCAFDIYEPHFTLGVSVDFATLRAQFVAAATASGAPIDAMNDAFDAFVYHSVTRPQELTELYPVIHPNGWNPYWNSAILYAASEYMFVRLDAYDVTSSAELYYSQPGSWVFQATIGATVNIKIDMIKKDGSHVSHSIPIHNAQGYTGPSTCLRHFQTCDAAQSIYGGNLHVGYVDGVPTVNIRVRSFYVPSSIFAAKRNYVSIYTPLTWYQDLSAAWFIGGATQAFAYSDETGWLPCQGLANVVLYDDDAIAFVCFRISNYGTDYYGLFTVLRRVLNSDGTAFEFNTVLTFRSKSSVVKTDYWGYPDCRVILNFDGSLVSVQNAHDITDGVYRLTDTTATLLHAYLPDEIEPVYMSDDGDVVATKTKIYLGGRTIDCVECCGVYFDHTHFVDKVGPDRFVIKKILPDVEAVVDTLSGHGHNFYELSEDSSVCIISRYYTNEIDPGSAYNAVVLDFADPVYRFELSDQIINQFLDPSIFASSPYPEQFGYPTIIPFGARYVTSCVCFRQREPEYGPAISLYHYVYNTPPGGTTLCKIMNHCPMHNHFIPGVTSNQAPIFPTSKAIVPQYHRPRVQRLKDEYDGFRLNKYIYHHTGKILRRISDKLLPIERITTMEIRRGSRI